MGEKILMKLTSINPSSNQILGEVEVTSEAEIKQLVTKAHEVKKVWQDLGIDGRNQVLTKFYRLIEDHAEVLAQLQASEMGMPISDTKIDIEDGVLYLRWYSEHAKECLAPEISYEDDKS